MKLPERLLAIHDALDRAHIAHAFGGAIALAYSTLDPRGTSDIDVNVFVDAKDPRGALAALPKGIDQPAGTTETIEKEGQIRLFWEDTPIDLFFNSLPVHEQAAANAKQVEFEGKTIPVLGPVELAVFKAMFDRTRDWADIEEMLIAETLDIEAVRETLKTLIGEKDRRFAKLDRTVREAEKGPRGLPK
jgi:hypothetical protein